MGSDVLCLIWVALQNRMAFWKNDLCWSVDSVHSEWARDEDLYQPQRRSAFEDLVELEQTAPPPKS